jgi:hypothetical protein
VESSVPCAVFHDKFGFALLRRFATDYNLCLAVLGGFARAAAIGS